MFLNLEAGGFDIAVEFACRLDNELARRMNVPDDGATNDDLARADVSHDGSLWPDRNHAVRFQLASKFSVDLKVAFEGQRAFDR